MSMILIERTLAKTRRCRSAIVTVLMLWLLCPLAATADDVAVGGPFTLLDGQGRTVTDTDFRGRFMLVLFGYTYCPDVCPTGATTLAGVLDVLGDEARNIAALFITLDPERDGIAEMEAYAAAFHPDLIGLTGSREAIAAVARCYRVKYRKVPLDDGDYTIDHSADVYVIGPDGAFIGAFDHDAPPEQAAATLRDLARGLPGG